MGSMLSRWKHRETTIEVLEKIDKEISQIEKFRTSTQQLRSKVIGNLILYSIIIYIVICVTLYFLIFPQTVFQQCLRFFPIFCFPILIYFLKGLLHWWFVRRISKKELRLQQLKDERKDILENVMETETYKKAKEILEKFDPETKKKLEEDRRQIEKPSTPNTPGSELRQRNVATSPNQAPSSHQAASFSTPINQRLGSVGFNPEMTPANRLTGPRPPMTPGLPRPLIRQNRTPLEKLVEYFVGDGPNNRYALICCNCYSHNGMALREEFEYIDYRCAYCRFYNPARKQRPIAPRLPVRVSSPMVSRSSSNLNGSHEEPQPGSPQSENFNDSDNVDDDPEASSLNDENPLKHAEDDLSSGDRSKVSTDVQDNIKEDLVEQYDLDIADNKHIETLEAANGDAAS